MIFGEERGWEEISSSDASTCLIRFGAKLSAAAAFLLVLERVVTPVKQSCSGPDNAVGKTYPVAVVDIGACSESQGTLVASVASGGVSSWLEEALAGDEAKSSNTSAVDGCKDEGFGWDDFDRLSPLTGQAPGLLAWSCPCELVIPCGILAEPTTVATASSNVVFPTSSIAPTAFRLDTLRFLGFILAASQGGSAITGIRITAMPMR